MRRGATQPGEDGSDYFRSESQSGQSSASCNCDWMRGQSYTSNPPDAPFDENLEVNRERSERNARFLSRRDARRRRQTILKRTTESRFDTDRDWTRFSRRFINIENVNVSSIIKDGAREIIKFPSIPSAHVVIFLISELNLARCFFSSQNSVSSIYLSRRTTRRQWIRYRSAYHLEFDYRRRHKNVEHTRVSNRIERL